MSDAGSGSGACVGQRVYDKSLHLSFNLAVNLKLLFKKEYQKPHHKVGGVTLEVGDFFSPDLL